MHLCCRNVNNEINVTQYSNGSAAKQLSAYVSTSQVTHGRHNSNNIAGATIRSYNPRAMNPNKLSWPERRQCAGSICGIHRQSQTHSCHCKYLTVYAQR